MSHKKRDWSNYNNSLVNRGSITLWLSPEAVKSWQAKKAKGGSGRPFQYSDSAILTATTIRHVFKLSLRACEGFLKSIYHFFKSRCVLYADLQVFKENIDLQTFPRREKVRHVVVDATGLKVSGEGEWKVKKHGPGKRHQWRKLHLAVDEKTQEIVFSDIISMIWIN
jgi:hypothetical protein